MPRLNIPIIILIFFLIDLALGAAYILNRLAGAPHQALTALLDLDGEGNLPTWYSSTQWFCVAIFLGAFAHHNFSLSKRKSWLLTALPLVFLAISMDETAQIHETLGVMSDALLPDASRENILFSTTGIWMFLIGVPFLIFFMAVIFSIKSYFQHAPGAFFKVLLGAGVMFAGALGIETFSNFVATGSRDAALQVFFEELCEMLGGTLVLWGSYELLQRHGFALRFEGTEKSLPHPRGARSQSDVCSTVHAPRQP